MRSGTKSRLLTMRSPSDHDAFFGAGAASGPVTGCRRLETSPATSVHPPEAALAALVVGDGLEQVPAAEVRPQRVGDPQLRVGELPQHEVREPHLAARA